MPRLGIRDLVILGLILLTGLIWGFLQTIGNPITPTDGAFKIFTTVLGAGLTILVLDKIWKYEEQKRWKPVRTDVMKLFSDEINGIFSDFATVLVPTEVFVGESTDIFERTRTYQLEKMAEFASGDVDEVDLRLKEEIHLLDGGYGELFEKRYNHLNDIDVKYGKFFEPRIWKPLISLERHLQSLAGNIRARNKMKENSATFVPALDWFIAYRVHEITKALEEFKNLEILDPSRLNE